MQKDISNKDKKIATDININKKYIFQVEIDEGLKKTILENMPNDLNILEKAIYVYIKMCKLLVYDEEFFAVNQKGAIAKKHTNIDNLKNITLENNGIVCYEFIAIYARLLLEIGIKNIKIHDGTLNPNIINNLHSWLVYEYEDFIISVDPLNSIRTSDMYLAKTNQPLKGIICKNPNLTEEFEKVYNKVNALIANKEDSRIMESNSPEEDFYTAALEYKKISQDFKIDDLNKITLFMKLINNITLTGMDIMSYITNLSKFLNCKSLRLTILRSNIPENNKTANVYILISINTTECQNEFFLKNRWTKFANNTKYYLYMINSKKIIQYSAQELAFLLSTNQLQYITRNIETGGGILPEIDKLIRKGNKSNAK